MPHPHIRVLSLICLFLTSLIHLKPTNNLERRESIYALISTAAVLAYGTLGLTCLCLVYLDRPRFPTILISLLILTITFSIERDSFAILKGILREVLDDLKHIIKSKRSSDYYLNILILASVLCLYVISIGPINHPDAIDYHLGVPYQNWLRTSSYIDGSLSQGMAGIGDYANIAFIQENTIWLIRTIQTITILPIALYSLKLKSNKLLILAFLITPAFVQWITIGKPLFLGESAIAICYVEWNERKSNNSLLYLLCCMLLSISFKISAFLICIPICIHIIVYEIFSSRDTKRSLLNVLSSKVILICLITLSSILLFRNHITGNFAYPLFSKYFTPDNLQQIIFEENIRGFGWNGILSFLDLLIPMKLSGIGLSLGPCLSVLLLATYTNNLFRSDHDKALNTIITSQMALLLCFGQIRVDYLAEPIILLLLSSKTLTLQKCKIPKIAVEIFRVIFLTQLVVSIVIFNVALSQTFHAVIDYDEAMNYQASGFSQAKLLNGNGNALNLAGRGNRSLLGSNYIDRDRFSLCINNSIHDDLQASTKSCIEKFDIKSIIGPNEKFKISNQSLVLKDFFEDNGDFICREELIHAGSRNPFNRHYQIIDLCNHKDILGHQTK